MDRKRTGIPPEKKLFLISAVITAAIALWGIVSNRSFAYAADLLMSGLKKQFSWLYLWVMLLFVLFSLVIALSPWGKIRLGADGDRPEYSTLTWFAMLFGAGMGIGLVFWGMAEPLSHYVQPMAGIEPQSAEAVRFSMRSSFMHWGVHPWSCYAIVGLGLAYFQFRKKKPAAASSLLTPFSRGGKWGRGLGAGGRYLYHRADRHRCCHLVWHGMSADQRGPPGIIRNSQQSSGVAGSYNGYLHLVSENRHQRRG